MNNVPLKEKSIVLIGFMGVGKTTIGQAIAKKLQREFIDIDEKIEKEYHMPTSDIFKRYGEKTFRKKEKDMIEHFSMQKFKVISVGGGAFLQKEIRDICLAECIVVFLDLTWDSWKERIALLIDSRPVLQGKSIDEIKELYYSRQPIYKENHLKIQTDDLDTEEAADAIIDSLKTT
ncbi:shikimate kinase [Virgibacillus profundi]|uniref:Shikimate kinase n=2 Tax=Virgibacillus profundi TaxID=2024555 RepID=A0A2A2I8X6_9BACI|nr:shikimate kinase [Virgibacillus profundi]PXY51931.1 shikimate kinase [Virgibacillus profundi]